MAYEGGFVYTRELIEIGQALDEISAQWLSDNHPRLAEAVLVEVEMGATPELVRRYVMRQTQRVELALRCEQAARWAAAQGGERAV